MIIKDLGTFFKSELQDIRQVWVAVALANDAGFGLLRSALKPKTKQTYLIGVDLPTPAPFLRRLHSLLQPGQLECRISKTKNITYHPKVYLFESTTGDLKAVIGSANLTQGGLSTNVEMNVLVDDHSTCAEIKDWYIRLYQEAFPLNEENIAIYEQYWQEIPETEKEKQGTGDLHLSRSLQSGLELDGIDFSDRYFKREHHMAFHREKWLDHSKIAETERKVVRDVFASLHDQLFSNFTKDGLAGLHPNTKAHLVSMHYHDPSRLYQPLNAMWLSYGKSEVEIKQYKKDLRQPYLKYEDQEDDKQSFINHARLQIRLEYNSIGIWILFAKNNGGGIVDRDHFRKNMRDSAYRARFFAMLKALPEPFWINVRRNKKMVSEFQTPDELYTYCKQDKEEFYFIIGRDYKITDPQMSEARLPGETLKVFQLLYPLYTSMRHYH